MRRGILARPFQPLDGVAHPRLRRLQFQRLTEPSCAPADDLLPEAFPDGQHGVGAVEGRSKPDDIPMDDVELERLTEQPVGSFREPAE